jgi:hypothetical protein
VPLGLVDLAGPPLGAVQVDQCQRTQILAQAGPRRVRNVGYVLQPACFFGHGRQVGALAGVQQPGDPQQLSLPLPFRRHRRRRPFGQGHVPLGRLQGPLRQLVERAQHGQFRIRQPRFGRKAGQELMGGGVPAREMQGGPVVSQQAGGQPPLQGGLGLLDGRHRLSVPSEPPRGLAVEPGDLIGFAAAQLQLQQIREQVVVAEPAPGPVYRHHKRVRGLQVFQ